MSLQDLPNNTTSFDPMVTYDDLFNQLLSGLQTTVSWPDISAGDGQNKPTLPWDVDHFDHQSAVLSSKLRQHHIATAAAGGRTDNIGNSSFKPPIQIGDNNNSIQNLFHGFTGSLTSNQTQNFGSTGAVMTAGGGGGGGAPSQPRQRVRARRGQATDPHSIAERLRRERIAERMKGLQELVPNANKTDKASMLDDIIDYVKFLQLQVKALSMSRLGTGANIVAEGGCVGRSSNGPAAVTEKQVVKLMEEDMGSAMQYLQGKGLCLMPISVANAGGGYGPSSPNMSVLTVQSANGLSVKDSP